MKRPCVRLAAGAVGATELDVAEVRTLSLATGLRANCYVQLTSSVSVDCEYGSAPRAHVRDHRDARFLSTRRRRLQQSQYSVNLDKHR